MSEDVAVKAEQIRDLKNRIADLSVEELPEVVFQHIRTRRGLVTLYATLDGEPIPVPEYMVASVMQKTLPDGRYMFTADKKDAPEYKLGNVKCFLHPESLDRVILEKAGLVGKTCSSAHLSSPYSKRIHAQHRHKQEWAVYQDYLQTASAAEERDERRQQLEATLAIARQRVIGSPPAGPGDDGETPSPCPEPNCDWAPKPGTKNALNAVRMHAVKAHPAKVAVPTDG